MDQRPTRAGEPARISRAAVLCLLGLVLSAAALQAQAAKKDAKQKQETKDLVTTIKIVVTAGPKEIPVPNASVYIRYADPHFLHPNSQIELDLKTDMKGVTELKDLPRRRIIIQVVKSGWQPFGKYFDLTKAEEMIKINLKTPPHWY